MKTTSARPAVRRPLPLAGSVIAAALAGLTAFAPLPRAAGQNNLRVSGSTYSYGSGTNAYDNIYVGGNGGSTLNQSGGTLSVVNQVVVGSDGTQVGFATSGAGTYNLTGGGLSASTLQLGANSGNGTFNLSGTGTVSVGQIGLGALNFFGPSPVGFFNQNGGSVTATQIFNGGLGDGTYNLNAGTATAGSVGTTGMAVTGTFNFNGGTLRAAGDSTTFFQGLTTANVRNGGAFIDTNGHSVTIAQNLVHSGISGDAATDGGLTKNSAGALTLSGTNTYTGTTVLNAGTLDLGGAGAVGGGGAITFQGGTLQYSAANTADLSARIANSTGAIALDTNGQNVTFATALAGTNTGGLTKTGAGTLTLSAANAYAGGLVVNAGALALTNNNALVGAATVNAGTLAVGDGTRTITVSGAAGTPALYSTAGDGAAGATANNAGSVTVAASATLAGGAGGAGGNQNSLWRWRRRGSGAVLGGANASLTNNTGGTVAGGQGGSSPRPQPKPDRRHRRRRRRPRQHRGNRDQPRRHRRRRRR